MSYEIRELDIGGILDQAIILFRDHYKFMLAVTVLIPGPLSILMNVLAESLDPSQSANMPISGNPSPAEIFGLVLFTQAPYFLSAFFLSLLVTSLTEGVVIFGIANRYLGKPARLAACLSVGLRRLPAMFFGTFLIMMGAMIGGMLCFIPGLVVTVLFYLFPPILILENAGPFEALGRSPRLVSGYAWQTFALIFLLAIIGFCVGMLGSIVPSAWAVIVLTSLVQGAFSAFTAVVLTVLYFSARCRIENLDLDLLVNDVDPLVPAESRL